MSSFFGRNEENLKEDAGTREKAGKLPGQYDGRKRLNSYAEIAIDRIEADPQHREHFDEASLESLAKSLKTHGQQQAIKVRWIEAREKYVIIAGERRFRAAQLAELPSLQCSIAADNITEDEVLVAQIIENAIREDLLASERAKAYHELMERKQWNATQLAEEIHVNKSTISRTLAILDLPEELKQAIDEGQISIKDAIAKNKTVQASTSARLARKPKPKRTKEVKLVVGGFTITVKARRLLTDELIVSALGQAIEQIQPSPKRKAA